MAPSGLSLEISAISGYDKRRQKRSRSSSESKFFGRMPAFAEKVSEKKIKIRKIGIILCSGAFAHGFMEILY